MKLLLLAYAAGQRQSTPVCMYVCVCSGAKDTPEVGKALLIIFPISQSNQDDLRYLMKDVYKRDV